MGLNRVVEEIRFKAEKEAERILGEGRAEGERILDETRKRLKEYEDSLAKEKASALEQIATRSRTLLQKRMKESMMEARREVIEKVYQDLMDRLKGMKGGERERLLRRMMEGAKRQIAKPETAYVRKEDAALAKRLFKGLGIRTKGIAGGFLLESGDGREVVDYSFETLVELLKGRTLKGASKALFGE